VRYEDGDSEELTEDEVEDLLLEPSEQGRDSELPRIHRPPSKRTVRPTRRGSGLRSFNRKKRKSKKKETTDARFK